MSAYPPARGLRQCDWLVTGDVSSMSSIGGIHVECRSCLQYSTLELEFSVCPPRTQRGRSGCSRLVTKGGK